MKVKRLLFEANTPSWDDIIELLKSNDQKELGKKEAIQYFKDLRANGLYNKFSDLLSTYKPEFILEFMTSLSEADAKQFNNRILEGFRLIIDARGRESLGLGYNEKLFRSIYNTLLDLIDVNKFSGNRLKDLLQILIEPNFYNIPYKDQKLIYNDFIKYAKIIGNESLDEALLEDKVLPSGMVVPDSFQYKEDTIKDDSKVFAKQHIKDLIKSIKSNDYKNVIDSQSSIITDDETSIKNMFKELSREHGESKVKKVFKDLYKQ